MNQQETVRLLAVLDQAIRQTDAEDDVVMVARWFIEDFANHLHSLQAEIDRLNADLAESLKGYSIKLLGPLPARKFPDEDDEV